MTWRAADRTMFVTSVQFVERKVLTTRVVLDQRSAGRHQVALNQRELGHAQFWSVIMPIVQESDASFQLVIPDRARLLLKPLRSLARDDQLESRKRESLSYS